MEEVRNCFVEMSPSCAGYAAVLLNLLTSFLFPAGKALELSEDAVVTLYSWETGLVQTLAGAGAVTTIPTAEGDGLVMGLLDRGAKEGTEFAAVRCPKQPQAKSISNW